MIFGLLLSQFLGCFHLFKLISLKIFTFLLLSLFVFPNLIHQYAFALDSLANDKTNHTLNNSNDTSRIINNNATSLNSTFIPIPVALDNNTLLNSNHSNPRPLNQSQTILSVNVSTSENTTLIKKNLSEPIPLKKIVDDTKLIFESISKILQTNASASVNSDSNSKSDSNTIPKSSTSSSRTSTTTSTKKIIPTKEPGFISYLKSSFVCRVEENPIYSSKTFALLTPRLRNAVLNPQCRVESMFIDFHQSLASSSSTPTSSPEKKHASSSPNTDILSDSSSSLPLSSNPDVDKSQQNSPMTAPASTCSSFSSNSLPTSTSSSSTITVITRTTTPTTTYSHFSSSSSFSTMYPVQTVSFKTPSMPYCSSFLRSASTFSFFCPFVSKVSSYSFLKTHSSIPPFVLALHAYSQCAQFTLFSCPSLPTLFLFPSSLHFLCPSLLDMYISIAASPFSFLSLSFSNSSFFSSTPSNLVNTVTVLKDSFISYSRFKSTFDFPTPSSTRSLQSFETVSDLPLFRHFSSFFSFNSSFQYWNTSFLSFFSSFLFSPFHSNSDPSLSKSLTTALPTSFPPLFIHAGPLPSSYKDRFNYASADCAARIRSTNPESKHASALLIDSKEHYFLNPCHVPNQHVILELCQDIRMEAIVLANHERFASTFHHVEVYVSSTYPTTLAAPWTWLGELIAENHRQLQFFQIPNPRTFAKYMKLVFVSHYGSQFYCPLTYIRVYGTTMLEEYKKEEAEHPGWSASSTSPPSSSSSSSPFNASLSSSSPLTPQDSTSNTSSYLNTDGLTVPPTFSSSSPPPSSSSSSSSSIIFSFPFDAFMPPPPFSPSSFSPSSSSSPGSNGSTNHTQDESQQAKQEGIYTMFMKRFQLLETHYTNLLSQLKSFTQHLNHVLDQREQLRVNQFSNTLIQLSQMVAARLEGLKSELLESLDHSEVNYQTRFDHLQKELKQVQLNVLSLEHQLLFLKTLIYILIGIGITLKFIAYMRDHHHQSRAPPSSASLSLPPTFPPSIITRSPLKSNLPLATVSVSASSSPSATPTKRTAPLKLPNYVVPGKKGTTNVFFSSRYPNLSKPWSHLSPFNTYSYRRKRLRSTRLLSLPNLYSLPFSSISSTPPPFHSPSNSMALPPPQIPLRNFTPSPNPTSPESKSTTPMNSNVSTKEEDLNEPEVFTLVQSQ